MLHNTKIETISLSADKSNVTLTTYVAGRSGELPFNNKRKAILVIPGGGYNFCSDREAEPVAFAYLAAGYNVFVLRYSVTAKSDATWPAPLIDASAAMKYIRDHAEELHIDPDYIFVIGFSAGGHLAGALGTLWDNDEVEAFLGMEKGYNKPTGMILSYPVISAFEYAHRGSFDNILVDKKDDEDALRAVSLEYQVNEKTVPAFIWTTAEDTLVPPQNSILFAQAMADASRPFELHIYPYGGHGASICTPTVGWKQSEICAWVNDSIRWMNSIKPENA